MTSYPVVYLDVRLRNIPDILTTSIVVHLPDTDGMAENTNLRTVSPFELLKKNSNSSIRLRERREL